MVKLEYLNIHTNEITMAKLVFWFVAIFCIVQIGATGSKNNMRRYKRSTSQLFTELIPEITPVFNEVIHSRKTMCQNYRDTFLWETSDAGLVSPFKERCFRQVQRNGATVLLPIHVYAEISAQNLKKYKQREPTAQFKNRLTQMNARRGDQAGHILAHSIGGTDEAKNIMPQHPSVNLGDIWKRTEKFIHNFLKEDARKPVNQQLKRVFWTAEIYYRPDLSNYRPVGFCIYYYTKDYSAGETRDRELECTGNSLEADPLPPGSSYHPQYYYDS